ncbi:MAG: isocitrate lyase/PEP mutase family protein [Burkholderiaceae bacterium]
MIKKDAHLTLKQKLAGDDIIVAPGIYDMISVRLADQMNFDCLYMTGFGTVASYLGEPDAGLATYTDMVNRVAAFCGASQTPIICDGDTGYGGLLNVAQTVRGYERAGAAGIQLEDQTFPKKCGHTLDRRVTSAADMVDKIKVAVESRASADFLIVARTDARTSLGLDEALRRAELYAKAGADVLFVESPETEDELKRIGSAFDVPLLANVVEGGRTPQLTPTELQDFGFSIAIYPGSGFQAAAHALRKVYSQIKALKGTKAISGEIYSFDEICSLMNFERVWDFYKAHPESSVGTEAS